MIEKGVFRTAKSSNAANTLEYKGYIGVVEYDDEAGIFHGEVINLRDVITFQGTCVDELREAFKESVEDYLAFCAERGEAPEKPFSGNLPLRIDPELHRKIYVKARQEGKSLNRWISEALERVLR
jgi:predicted HicB family RNase H-like nuclease